MRKSLLLAVTAFLLAGCGLGAPAYPHFGDVAYRIEGTTAAIDENIATHTVIYRDGPNLRIETSLPEYGPAIVVFDQSTNAAYVLNPTVQPSPTAPTIAPAAPTTTPPGATSPNAATPATGTPTSPPPSVIGIAVRISDASAPQPLETAWAALGAQNAKSVGNCRIAGERGHEWAPREPPAPGVERTACITEDGIVLRVRENDKVLFEATGVARGPQSASLFGVPPGYQMINPAAVAVGIGEQMNELNSVTGSLPPS